MSQWTAALVGGGIPVALLSPCMYLDARWRKRERAAKLVAKQEKADRIERIRDRAKVKAEASSRAYEDSRQRMFQENRTLFRAGVTIIPTNLIPQIRRALTLAGGVSGADEVVGQFRLVDSSLAVDNRTLLSSDPEVARRYIEERSIYQLAAEVAKVVEFEVIP